LCFSLCWGCGACEATSTHENPRFGEDEVKSLCKTFYLNNQEIHLGFIEHKASVGKSISNKFNKLLVAVNR